MARSRRRRFAMTEVANLLAAIERGDSSAANRLLPLVYDELRQLAAIRLDREPAGQTLQPTALVHEAYLRLVGDGKDRHWDNCGHFFAAAATAMRRIAIERARRKRRAIHGGGRKRLDVEREEIAAPPPDDDLIALDAALSKLAQFDSQKARLVELRYFAGFSADRAAAILGISPSTADRHWAFARAWLRREIEGEAATR